MENKKTPRKRKVLDLADRVKVIERHNKGETATAISLSLGCGKTQIQEIVNDKESILSRWRNGESSTRKQKRQKTMYQEINDRAYRWFLDMRQRNIQTICQLSVKFTTMQNKKWRDLFSEKNQIRSSLPFTIFLKNKFKM